MNKRNIMKYFWITFFLSLPIFGNASTPADENFDSQSLALKSSPVTINDITYTLISPASSAQAVYNDAVDGTDRYGITDSANSDMMFMYGLSSIGSYSNANVGDIDYRFASTSGDEFKLVSMEAASITNANSVPSQPGSINHEVTITGYKNSVSVVSDTIDFTSSDSANSVTYTKNASTNDGTLTFDSSWGDIDEVRFTTSGKTTKYTFIGIDELDFSAVVVAAIPSLTSADYNANTGVLTITGADLTAGDGIDETKFTLTGEGGATYTLVDQGAITATNTTTISITLDSTNKNAVNLLLNKDGTSSTGSTTYNLAADANWNTTSSDESAEATQAITVSNVQTPTITSATYDASTGALVITGTSFVKNSGATNDLDVSKLTLTGENADTYTLTTSSVEVTSTTSASVTLNAIDQLNVHGLLNLNGTSSVSSTTYNLAGAENWMPGHSGTDADTTSNGITVSNVQTPTITGATYDASTGALVVTGTNLVKANGATNDITVSKLTITGEGSGTKVLTTSDVEITSATSFTVTLSAADKSAVNLILNKNGTSSTDSTTYNLSASDDWNSVIGNTDISDTTNSITVSNVSNPTITSSTYNISTGTLVVTGTNFVSNSGATNDIDITKLSVVGDASASYTLTTSNVEVSNDTSFSVVLNATDQLNVNGLLNKNGTSSGDGTTYNLSAADNWMQGALASNDISDTTGNAITVSNVQIPTITSATYDVSTGILVVTGTNFVKKVGATNDIDVSKLTLTGQGSGTKALTTTNVEINSATSFSVTLTSADKTDVNVLLNKDGLSSVDSVTYNLAAAEDWMSGADASSNIADTSSNAITVSNADNTPPTISSISIANSAMKIGDTISVTITVASDSDDYTGSGAITGTIGGFTLSNLSKTNNTTYTASFTVTSGGSDVAAGSSIPVSFTLKDSAGNISSAYTTAITQSSDSIDANKPTLSSVSISSNNTSSSNAKLGDVITLTFTSSETLSSTPTVTIAGQSASVTNTSGNNYSATYTMQNSDTEGTVNFTIDFSDSAGNNGTQVTSVSDSSSVTFDKTAPVLTDGNISISGASGAYKIGDTITATWNNTAGGDNNSDISSVAVDFSAFGGGNSVAASNSSGTWSASYTITAGNIDSTNLNVSIKATDDSGNSTTTADTTNATLDNQTPVLTDGNISISGASGTNGAYKEGDAITATWNNTAGGDNNSDISSVAVDFSAFGGGNSVAASNSSGTWSATYTITAGNIDTTNLNVSIKAIDDVGNSTTTADTTNATLDNQAPVLTAGNISISGASGTSGAYKVGDTVTATWNNTAGGDNNSDISSVAVDFSAFGGGNSVAATNLSGTWSAAYTITAGNIDTTNLNVSIKAIDDVGNSTITADTTNATLDNLAPIASIASQKDSMILSEQITVTFTLNKESTDFTVDDISVNGGSLSNFAQDSSNTKVYTATLTPDSSLTTSITLDVNATKFTDSVGNNNVASSQKSITVLPSVLSYSPVLDSTGIALNAKLKLEFSENLVKGTGNIIIKKVSDDSILETIDVLSNNVVIENLPSTEVTKTTVTITRSNDFELNTQYYVTIDTNVFKDIENNSYLGISDKVTWKFTSTDNRAPVITNNNGNASATISVDENQISVIDIEATDADSGQTHVYSLLGTDASLFNINSSTGVVTFKTSPNYEVKNSYSITVKVADNLGGEDTQNLMININNTNDNPTISIGNSLSTNEDTAKDLTYTYTDEDGDTVTATEKTAPSKGSISISGTTITYTPSANKNGNDSFTLTLSDGNGYSVDKTVSVSITAIDDSPTITTDLSNQTQNEDGKGLVINLATSDIDSDSSTATYTASSSDTSIAKAYIRDGKLIVVPVANANGAVTISVTTTVGGLSSTKTFVYTLTSVNDRPTISNIGDISHDQTSSVITKTITFDIWDDVDVTSLTASSSNTNLLANNSITVSKLSSTQGQIVYTISANNAGDTTVTIIARDVESLEYKESFNISVKAANDAQCVENTNTALVFDTIKSNNSYQDSVTSNLGLVNSIDSVCSSNITWASSDTSVIDTSGVVTQASEDKTISITATITKGEFTSTKVFLITVPKGTITDSEAIAKLLFETIKEQNLTKYQITSKLNLVETILGKTITWSSSNDNVISPYSGYVTRTSSDESVTLTATIGSATKNFALTVLKEETSDAQKVEKDKSMLTLASLLDKNIDADNIKYNLVKPLPNTGGNGSTITWATSNSACITIDGDVVRDASSDKYVTLTATINNNGQSDTKEFIFRVLQNKIESNSSTTFKNAVDTASGSQVTTSENGNDVTTQSSFDNSLLSAVEKVISQESVKSILEFVDKVVNVYLNTDGTAQSTLQNSNGQSSSMKVESNGSTTNVDASGNIESSDNTSNGSIKLQLKTDGSVSHEVVNTSSSTTSTATSTIEGSSVEADKDGNVQTTSEVRSNGTLYKIVVSTDNEGKTTTKYVSINTTTGDEVETKNVISPSTPYPSGNSATITEIDGQLYISTTVPLDGQIVIE